MSPAPVYQALDPSGYKCQGWYVQKYDYNSPGYSAADCQALCTQSAYCGATTFQLPDNSARYYNYCARDTACPTCSSLYPPRPTAVPLAVTLPPPSCPHAPPPFLAGYMHFKDQAECQAAISYDYYGSVCYSNSGDVSDGGYSYGYPTSTPTPSTTPAPSYVKLEIDGECQGWSLTPSVCYPNSGYCSTAKDCQDMCDQSDKCGATTFLQSSCATRARGRAAQASLTCPTSAR
jgi:hypothetical protein